MSKANSSVWMTRDDCWDEFLNDPVLSEEFERARQADDTNPPAAPSEAQIDHSLDERLLAYESPVTDEVLRQSID